MVKRTERQGLQQELEQVRAQLAQALEQVTSLTKDLMAAQQRIAELDAQKPPPPALVKANKPERPKTARKRRASEQNRARRCEPPTQVVEHGIAQCPKCQGALSGMHIGRTRQVIELPPPPPVEIIEHQVQRGWCSLCKQWQEAPLDLHDQVVGHGRIGIRLATTVATMRTVLRLPIRLIQQWVATQHQVQLSVGALTGLVQRLATHLHPVADQILARIRGSPAAFADETGWRENGQNGYIWEVGTPEGVAPDNNAAERGVRPLVVARKISGGTRSSSGSDSLMVLSSVVQTCLAQSLDVFSTLRRLCQLWGQ